MSKNEKILVASGICIIVIISIFVNIELIIDLNTGIKKATKEINLSGGLAPVIFILLQILQVLVFFIPGEIVQTAGGYAFGILYGMILSTIGIALGSLIQFFLGRSFGNRLFAKLLSIKKYEHLKRIICKEKNTTILFVLYAIPGFPKDVLGYIAGLSNISLKRFIIVTTAARFPGIAASTLFGANLFDDNYILLLYFTLVIASILVFSITKHEKVLDYFR